MIRCWNVRLGVQGYTLRSYDGLEHHLLVCLQQMNENGVQLPYVILVWKSLRQSEISRMHSARPTKEQSGNCDLGAVAKET